MNKLEGITYNTSASSAQIVGKTKTTDWRNPIKSLSFMTTSEYEFIGFFGSYSTETVYSLGAIRKKVDCKGFSNSPPLTSSSNPPSTYSPPTTPPMATTITSAQISST
jgi:hypothetical protein